MKVIDDYLIDSNNDFKFEQFIRFTCLVIRTTNCVTSFTEIIVSIWFNSIFIIHINKFVYSNSNCKASIFDNLNHLLQHIHEHYYMFCNFLNCMRKQYRFNFIISKFYRYLIWHLRYIKYTKWQNNLLQYFLQRQLS